MMKLVGKQYLNQKQCVRYSGIINVLLDKISKATW